MAPKRILVVEDEDDILELLTFSLTRHAHAVTGATSGEEAMGILGRETFDLILLDIMLPGKNGFEILHFLKNETPAPDTPVIFLSALSNTSSVTKGLADGAVDYVTKPFNVSELLARVRLHLELKTVREELRLAVATKEKFFRIIAHDLRGPTAATHGYAKLLARDYDSYAPGKRQECLTNMVAASGKVVELLEDLLSWTQVHTGDLAPCPEKFPIYAEVTKAVGLLAPQAEAKSIRLSLPGIDPACAVYADRGMVRAMLRNLMDNAIKFTPAGGSVQVTARTDAGMASIAVADTGVGISPADMDKLFRIDCHHSTPGTAQESGTGLGLILCREFADKNNGRLSVCSTPGQGSKFTFTLPLAAALATLAETPSANAPPGRNESTMNTPAKA